MRMRDADGRPGRYYVTIRDGRGRTCFALGPFVQLSPGQNAHARALLEVRRVRRLVAGLGLDGWHDWSYGTAWLPLYGAAPVGKFNGRAPEGQHVRVNVNEATVYEEVIPS